MDTSFDDYPPAPDAILELIKEALAGCRQSSSRLCGFVRGLEIGASTIGRTPTACDPMESLRERSLRLSESDDDYLLGVCLGIDLATNVASALIARVQAPV